jgi:hypothetical protein
MPLVDVAHRQCLRAAAYNYGPAARAQLSTNAITETTTGRSSSHRIRLEGTVRNFVYLA